MCGTRAGELGSFIFFFFLDNLWVFGERDLISGGLLKVLLIIIMFALEK